MSKVRIPIPHIEPERVLVQRYVGFSIPQKKEREEREDETRVERFKRRTMKGVQQ